MDTEIIMKTNSAGMAPLLSVQNLTIGLPAGLDRPYAVKDINFDLYSGDILCMIGESGSGKSVTASAIMGLLPRAISVLSGSIRLKGEEIVGQSEDSFLKIRGRVVSIVFQDPLSALNPLMTIGQQIREVFDTHNVLAASARDARVVELLQEVGLPDPEVIQHQYPFRLSGGQRQRVMIAIALALDPDILIADEPTTALDVTTQAQILRLIRDLQVRKNIGVIFVTHDVGVVAELATRVIVLEKGVQVEDGVTDAVLNHPQHPYTQRLIAAVPRLRTEARPVQAEPVIILEAKNISKTYSAAGSGLFGKKRILQAVNNVSFQLARGETLGVVGESGSGKSTLGRLMMKLVEADSGEILLDGTDVHPLPEKLFRPMRSRIQMVFQDPYSSLNPRHTIGTALTVGPLAHGMPVAATREKARALLDRVGLQASAYDRYPHEFSGGQRQRIGIARALMFDPAIIIADEAVSALDVSIQAQVLDLLNSIQAENNLAMIFITHDLLVASQICDKILVMHRGTVVETGAPQQIFFAPQQEYTRQLVSAIPGLSHQFTNAA